VSRLFVGIFPAGIVYADREVQEHGDYKRLAFLPYRTLEVEWSSKTVEPSLRAAIEKDVAAMQARRGQRFEVSACGQYVVLGGT
jgi:hypothetical protein